MATTSASNDHRRGSRAAALGGGLAAALSLLLTACGGGAAAPASSAAATATGASPSAARSTAAAGASAPASTAAAKPAASASTQAAQKVAPAADWQAQWDKTVAAAKQEGALTIDLNPGDLYQVWMRDFQKAYPESKLEAPQLIGRDFVARILPERQAGKFAWDAYIGGSESGTGGLKPAGALDPLQPALLLPEILDDSKWVGGFAAGFTDKEGQYVYDVEGDVIPTVYINRDVIPESQLSRIEDLTDPKWRGKMSIFDPRGAGNGAATGGHWIMAKGADWWRELLNQQPAVTLDRRQQIEWVIRGQYPIALAGSNTVLPEFQNQGVGKNVKPLGFDTDMGRRLNQSVNIALINKRPHPNAAAVFVNWALSKDGQASYVNALQESSRRLDVPKGPAETPPQPHVKYLPSVNAEANSHFVNDASQIAKEIIK